MLQEPSTSWDLNSLLPEPTTGEKLFVFFLFAVIIVGIVEFFRSRRLKLPAPNSGTLPSNGDEKQLQASADRLKNLMYFTLLTGGLLALYKTQLLAGRLAQEQAQKAILVLYPLRLILVNLEFASLVLIFLFLVR